MSIQEDLKTYELLIEQRLKSHSRNWLIALGVAIVIVVILFFTVFKKGKPDNSYESQIRSMDSTIKYQQKYIDALQKTNDVQDSTIVNLNEKYKANRPIETRIIHSYEKIPIDINSLDREQLRKQVSDY